MSNHELISQYYETHRDELLAFVSSRLRGADEAEDLVQDVFLRLLSGCRPITPVTLPSLIYTMARNLICDYYRRRQSRDDYEHTLRGTSAVGNEVETLLSAREITEQMERGLARLPEACREVYRLHIYGGMRVSEISLALGQGYKSVEHRLGLARKEIRNYLRHIS